MDYLHPAMQHALARACPGYSTDPVHDAARYYEAQDRHAAALEAAQAHMRAETLAQAAAGNYARLMDAMDYRDHDQIVMRALMSAAAAGHQESRAALNTLATHYAELHAEVAE